VKYPLDFERAPAMSQPLHRTLRTRTGSAGEPKLGDRLRELRVDAGMTQTDLAGERFSKEYLSQIERGKTRPTRETIEWLAERLAVDPGFLESGVSSEERGRVEAALARAEALTQDARYDEALAEYGNARSALLSLPTPELEVRMLSGEAWVKVQQGNVREALDQLARARNLTERAQFSDLDRAEVLFRIGVCRYKLSSISTAVSLLSEALALAERSGMPCDLLRSQILDWRSRGYRRQRDWEAAREDVERALELAEGMSDMRSLGAVYFQASLIAERNGHWVLARTYAEKAKNCFDEIADRLNAGRLMNNLGGLAFLLGKPEEAKQHLKEAFAVLLENDSRADAAQVVLSLAEVHLGEHDYVRAEEQARQALELLGDREDERMLSVGTAQLSLGKALLEQGRLDEADAALATAEETFTKSESSSHRAAAWVAQGDLAARRGDDRGSARLYRLAAEALQDFRF
jgi:tetratricopeptide (TPR) repeat protein